MKILGAIVYLSGFLILGYLIEETNLLEGFSGVVIIFLVLIITMGLGTVLMKSGRDDSDGE